MEKEIKIAAKLYQCRDTVKNLFKNDFKEKIEPYKTAIKKYMASTGKDEIHSVLEICNTEEIKEKGMAVLMFMAAATEMIEPSVD